MCVGMTRSWSCRVEAVEADEVRPGTNTWSAYTYPRRSGRQSNIPVYSNDGLSRNYGTAANPSYPEAAYGFQRFRADIG
jgi:hypothetical protein